MSNVHINLTANTASYVQRIRDAKTQTDRNLILMEKRIDAFAKDVNNNFTNVNSAINVMLGGLGKIKGGGYIAAIGALGLAGMSVTASFHSMQKQTAETTRELKAAAQHARMSAQDFKSVAMVGGMVGLSLEKMGDISKDVFDKLGDYATTGGGAFTDFFDVVNEKSSVTVQELQKLTAPDVLVKVVEEMEKAGASGAQMTFVMESIADESSRLIPLLRNGAVEFKRLQTIMNEFAKTPLLLASTAQNVQILDAAFEGMWSSFGTMMTEKFSTLNEYLIQMAKNIKNVMDDATLDDQAMKLGSSFAKGEYKITGAESVTELTNQIAVFERAIENATTGKGAMWLTDALPKEMVDRQNEERKQLSYGDFESAKKLAQKHREEINAITGGVLDSMEANLAELKSQLQSTMSIDQSTGAGKEAKEKIEQVSAFTNTGDANKDIKQSLTAQQTLRKMIEDSNAQILDANKRLAEAESDITKEKIKQEIATLKNGIRSKEELIEAHGKRIQEINHQKNINQLTHDAATEKNRVAQQGIYHEIELANYKMWLDKGQITKEQYNAYKEQSERNHLLAVGEIKAENAVTQYDQDVARLDMEMEQLQYEYDNKNLSHEAFLMRKAELDQQYADAETRLKQTQLSMWGGVFGQMEQLFEEGSGAQKAAFAIQKGIAIAEAMLMMESNAMMAKNKAMQSGTGAAAVAAGETAYILSKVKDGISIGVMAGTAIGQFHSGTDEVDQTGSYILKKGERVVQETANKDLTNYLKTNKSGGGAVSVDAPLNIQGDTTISETKLTAMLAKQRDQIAKLVKVAQSEDPSLR
ncbi:hypothetical protein [Vibrio vulnificus]|uniref:hypothetical protein n=1 Tax=Vibrio vulnificus TaxID=672 RepID=UPI003242B5B4